MRRALVRVVRRPRLSLAILALLTALAASQLPRLEIDTDGRSLIPRHDPTFAADLELRRMFGGADPVLIAFRPETDDEGGVFTPAALGRLRALTEAIQRAPGVDPARVTSLATITRPRTDGGILRLEPLLPDGPLDRTDAAAVAREVSGHPLWDGLLVSADREAAAVVVELPRSDRRRAVLAELAAAAKAARGSGRVEMAGAPVVEASLGEHIVADLARLIPLVAMVIGALLLAVFRRPLLVALALAAVLAAVVWTLGLMAALGRPLYLVTATLPVILIAVGTADIVHVYSAFRRREGPAGGGHRAAVVAAVLGVAEPLVATSVTTAAGFLAFAASSMPPLRDFGLFTAFGVLAALAIALTGVPAGLSLLPPRPRPRRSRRGDGPAAPAPGVRWLRRPRWVIAAWALVLALSAVSAARLRVQDSWVGNFPPSSSLVETDRWLNRAFLGTHTLVLVVDGGSPDAVHDPRLLAGVHRLGRRLEARPGVGGTRSAADLVRAVHDDLGGPGRGASRAPPGTSSEIAEALLVASMAGGGELDRWVDGEHRRLLVRVFLRRADYRRVAAVMAAARGAAAEELPARARVRAAGDAAVGHAAVALVVGDQLRSLALALFGVALVLAVALRSATAVVLHLLPVLAAVPLTFGAMAAFGWSLGIATSTFAAVAIGIGVDAGVHLLAQVRRAQRRAPPATALGEALAVSGRPIAIHVVAVAAGFATLALSETPPVRAMGVLVALSLLAAAAAALTALPALLLLWPGLLPAPWERGQGS